MRRLRRAVLLLAAGLAACSRGDAPPPALPPAPVMAATALPEDDERSLFLPDLMDFVVDPAAGVLFAAAGQHGWTQLDEPRSDEAWQAVGDAATELGRIAGLLGQPLLARGRSDWTEAVDSLSEGATAAAAAARRHDARALYAAGVQLRAACQACHAQHAPRLLR